MDKKSAKARYVEERKAELSDADEHIKTAQESIRETAADVKAGLETKLSELRQFRGEAAERLDKVRESAEETWEHVRDDAEYTWRALRASVNYFRSHFRNRK